MERGVPPLNALGGSSSSSSLFFFFFTFFVCAVSTKEYVRVVTCVCVCILFPTNPTKEEFFFGPSGQTQMHSYERQRTQKPLGTRSKVIFFLWKGENEIQFYSIWMKSFVQSSFAQNQKIKKNSLKSWCQESHERFGLRNKTKRQGLGQKTFSIRVE